MNRPLPVAFCLFIAGIIFAHHISVPFLVIVGLIASFFILPLLFKNSPHLIFNIICAGLVFLLAVAAYLNFNKLPASHIARLLEDQPRQYYIEGVIVSSPDYFWRSWGKRRCSFLLRALSYKKGRGWVKADGLSRVNIKDSQREYSYGDTLVVFGELRRPSLATNPGQFDYAAHLKTKRIYTLIEVSSDGNIESIEKVRPLILKKFIFDARANIERLVKRTLSGQDAAILNAMLIGRRADLSKELREHFVKTGTAHVLAISGLHVAIISTVIFFILRLIRIPRKIASISVIGFLIIYTFLAGAMSPILRATIMITVYLLGFILERDFDIYSALSLAGIVILTVNPMELFNPGYVLSFVCVFSICYLTPKLESFIIPTPILKRRFSFIQKSAITRYLLKLILGSLAVYIGVAPLIGYYFNILSPITVLANLFIVPLLGVVLFFGILLIITGSLLAPLAVFFSYPLHFILLVFTGIIFLLSNIPFGHFYIPDIPLYAIAAYYIFLWLVIKRKSLGLNWIRISAIGLLIVNIFIWRPLFVRTDQLRVTFLDVGGGDSIFLEFPDGRSMLLNAGRANFYYNQAESVVLPFVWSRGRRSIDCLFLTCSDSAHLRGAWSILKKASVRYFISSALHGKDKLHKKLKELIISERVKDIELKDGMRVEGFGDIGISARGPLRVKITYKDVNFLFSPQEKIIQRGEEKTQLADPAGSGAITIITDGLRVSKQVWTPPS